MPSVRGTDLVALKVFPAILISMRNIVPVVVILSVAGCAESQKQMPPGTVGPQTGPLDVPEMSWPFWPDRMRIHPLSYIVDDAFTGETTVEARLEFFDPDGHTTRGLGVARVEMHDAGDLFRDEPLVWWDVNLTDLEMNGRLFDDVTSTYLMRLSIEAPQIPRRPQLIVHFRSADGREFEAEYNLPERRVEPLPAPEEEDSATGGGMQDGGPTPVLP